MVIDGAHNNESIDALVDTIRHYYEEIKLIFYFLQLKESQFIV